MRNYKENIELPYKDIEMPGGYKWNHMNTLKGIELAYMSRFKNGEFDSQGFKKFFFNIVKAPCDVAEKFTDLDTSNFIFIPDGDSEWRVFLLQKDFRVWARTNGWGKLINDLGHDRPKYGSVVVKKAGNTVKKVQLHNLRFDPTAESLRDSAFVYEAMKMGMGKMEGMKGWDLTELKTRPLAGEYLVYECYHKDGKRWKREIVADVFCDKTYKNRAVESFINREDQLPAVVLYEDTVDDIPYKEDHWERVPGRWLGYGFVEYLLENQIATNEAENYERKGLIYSSLKLFQTRDQSIGGKNVLTSAKNGDILTADSEVTPIAMEERNLAAYNATRQRWDGNTQRKTFSTDIATGANLPSRTPLGVANVQASMVESFYEKKREDFGLFLKEVLYDFAIPSFRKLSQREHTIVFSGSDQEMARLSDILVEGTLDSYKADYWNKHGFFPEQSEIDRVRAELKEDLANRKFQNIKIPAFWYDDAKFFMEIEVTGEAMDTSVRSQLLMTAMQMLGTNPAILQNPVIRSMFTRFLNLGGITLAELGISTQEMDAAPMMPQGGSVAVPAPAGMTKTTTL